MKIQGLILGCVLFRAIPAVAGANEATYVRTIPVTGYQFDVDWTNHDLYTADSQTVSRYDLATGAFETSWSAPAGSLINDVAAGIGQVFVAAAGTRALYAYSAGGTLLFQTDLNTRNRIGDVRGMLAASSGAYLVGNPGTILRISLNPFGYPQLVAGWGVYSNDDVGWETCSPSPTPPPYCYGSGYSGEELGKVTAAVDLAMRQNVENTGSFALFVLERRYLAGSEPGYRVSVFSDEQVPTSFAPQGFLFGSLRGTGAGQLDDPYGIALDVERGRVYIADQGNNRVAVYAFQTGIFQRAFGWGVDTGANQLETCTPQSGCQKGLAATPLHNPVRVQVDPSNGDLYVSYLGGISQFDTSGIFTDGFESGGVGGWSSSVGSI